MISKLINVIGKAFDKVALYGLDAKFERDTKAFASANGIDPDAYWNDFVNYMKEHPIA